MSTTDFNELYANVYAILMNENLYGTLDDLIDRIQQVSDGYQQSPNIFSGSGKYSSQAKHYLNQDYYTFVHTMPKKRFL